ncbi:MAG: GYD domain-containing protein [Chloroflexi bacterium]|nr:GYD domain-containing protein [Chloroflexota bacterium]
MGTYIIFTRIGPEAFSETSNFKQIAATVSTKIKKECPGLVWKSSYATLGRFDVVDVVEADNPASVERAALIIRANGHATTETMMATPWKEFVSRL